jgi:eukaryotic-like serine/threonine-protein kinase
MGDIPNLTPDQIEAEIDGVSDVQPIGQGGQKSVFSGLIDGQRFALKFLKAPGEELDSEDTEFEYTPDIVVRAKREVETMRQCQSPYMVKLGPIGLEFITINGQSLVFFTEELIAGADLQAEYVRPRKCLGISDVIQLGVQITHAIAAIWELKKVHRDIKPGNIMRRENGEFVLLDAGLAFDKLGESVSGGGLVGTPIYFSPEQFEYTSRRTVLDFRSDMFALGVTMYQLATAQHPFYVRGDQSGDVYSKIRNAIPTPPHEINGNVPEELSDIVLRMLGKSPHIRFRKYEQLIERLNSVEVS